LGQDRNAFRVLTEKPELNRQLGKLGVNGRKILKWSLVF
jgi:hypothetical protein